MIFLPIIAVVMNVAAWHIHFNVILRITKSYKLPALSRSWIRIVFISDDFLICFIVVIVLCCKKSENKSIKKIFALKYKKFVKSLFTGKNLQNLQKKIFLWKIIPLQKRLTIRFPHWLIGVLNRTETFKNVEKDLSGKQSKENSKHSDGEYRSGIQNTSRAIWGLSTNQVKKQQN